MEIEEEEEVVVAGGAVGDRVAMALGFGAMTM